jgi:hypothetical protein
MTSNKSKVVVPIQATCSWDQSCIDMHPGLLSPENGIPCKDVKIHTTKKESLSH